MNVTCPYSKEAKQCKYSKLNGHECYNYCDHCAVKQNYKPFNDNLDSDSELRSLKIRYAFYKVIVVAIFAIITFGIVDFLRVLVTLGL